MRCVVIALSWKIGVWTVDVVVASNMWMDKDTKTKQREISVDSVTPSLLYLTDEITSDKVRISDIHQIDWVEIVIKHALCVLIFVARLGSRRW